MAKALYKIIQAIMHPFKILSIVFLLSLQTACAPGPEGNRKVNTTILKKSTKSWDGGLLPNYPNGQPEVTIMKIIIPPKTEIPLHKHSVINAGYVIKGALTVYTKDNEILRLTTGDAAIETVNKWHHAENESNEDAELVVFYAGAEGQPLSIKK